MYKIQLIVQNPLTGANRTLVFKFDPATITEAKWTAAYSTVRAEIDGLVAAAATTEPPAW